MVSAHLPLHDVLPPQAPPSAHAADTFGSDGGGVVDDPVRCCYEDATLAPAH